MQMVICNLKREECELAVDAREDTYSPLPAPRSLLFRRRGVTLIELLIVILIISILAALVLGVAAVAGETARVAQTKHTVERLHTLLMEFYDSFKTRRVKLNPDVESKINSQNASAAQKRQLLAEARLYALRELMLMEVPDRWSDVLLAKIPVPANSTQPKMPIYLDTTNSSGTSTYGRTPLAAAYLRRYEQLAANATTTDQVQALTENQGAECLYMIITMACGDGEARSLFKESEIADTDGDGAPEFLDGWGHPINFLRWAPGFDSQIQLNANNYTGPDDPNWIKDAAKDHDPFDVYRVDQYDPNSNSKGSPKRAAFRLVPLIFSGGRDEVPGIRLVKTYYTWVPDSANPSPAGNMMPGYPRLSPYYQVPDPDDPTTPIAYLGTPNADGTATDNIHNHMLGLR